MAALAHTWGGPRTPSMGALHTLTSRSLPGALANTILPPGAPPFSSLLFLDDYPPPPPVEVRQAVRPEVKVPASCFSVPAGIGAPAGA